MRRRSFLKFYRMIVLYRKPYMFSKKYAKLFFTKNGNFLKNKKHHYYYLFSNKSKAVKSKPLISPVKLYRLKFYTYFFLRYFLYDVTILFYKFIRSSKYYNTLYQQRLFFFKKKRFFRKRFWHKSITRFIHRYHFWWVLVIPVLIIFILFVIWFIGYAVRPEKKSKAWRKRMRKHTKLARILYPYHEFNPYEWWLYETNPSAYYFMLFRTREWAFFFLYHDFFVFDIFDIDSPYFYDYNLTEKLPVMSEHGFTVRSPHWVEYDGYMDLYTYYVNNSRTNFSDYNRNVCKNNMRNRYQPSNTEFYDYVGSDSSINHDGNYCFGFFDVQSNSFLTNDSSLHSIKPLLNYVTCNDPEFNFIEFYQNWLVVADMFLIF